MIVEHYTGHRSPPDANVYLGRFVNQFWSGTQTVLWYSTDGSEADREAYRAEKARREELRKQNAGKEDNYPIWK